MTFADFVSILDQSINDKYGWANTWESFTVRGRWFSISGNRWPNSFDDYTGSYKLHPKTVKKLLADGLAEEVEYRKGKGTHNQVKNKDHIKLILTEKGQALVKKRPTYEELELHIIELESQVVNLQSQLGIAFEIMFDSQIAECQHLFERSIDIEHSGSTNQTKGER